MKRATDLIRRYTSVAAVIDILARGQLAVLSPEAWDDKNDRHFMAIYKKKKAFKRLSGLCATHVTETYHHWRVFTGASDGACLVIKRVPLEKFLKTMREIRFGKVEYLNVTDMGRLTSSDGDVDRLPFVKRRAYKDEGEYRIVFQSYEPGPDIFLFPIEPQWVESIILNPWMPSSFVESIRKNIRKIEGFENLKVTQSRVINSDMWKKLGDKVVGSI